MAYQHQSNPRHAMVYFTQAPHHVKYSDNGRSPEDPPRETSVFAKTARLDLWPFQPVLASTFANHLSSSYPNPSDRLLCSSSTPRLMAELTKNDTTPPPREVALDLLLSALLPHFLVPSKTPLPFNTRKCCNGPKPAPSSVALEGV